MSRTRSCACLFNADYDDPSVDAIVECAYHAGTRHRKAVERESPGIEVSGEAIDCPVHGLPETRTPTGNKG